MTMKGDLLILGGTMVDPARDFYGKSDVVVRNGKIMEWPSGETVEAEKVINAEGCLVLPGLIDHHAHAFPAGTDIGIYPDSTHLPQGVTTVVDQGSAGVNNCESFFNSIVGNSQTRIFAYLNVSPAGLSALPRALEPVDPKTYELESARSLFEKYDKRLLGLKVRQSKEIVGELGLVPLAATVQMANALGCKVTVHTTNSPGNVNELTALLRPGDIFTHMYQGQGNTILDDKRRVRKAVRDARSRGILFETADGRAHFTFSVAQSAISDGFEPDLISTDLVKASQFDRPAFGLPLMMSKYLCLGIPLQRVVKACTSTPARLIGMEGKIGTLSPGAYADIAIFQLKEMTILLRDIFDQELACNQILIPRLTVLKGRVVYRSLDF